MVEFLRDVVRQLQMLPLVVAHRHARGMVGVNVGRHQVRIDIQPGRRVLPVLAGLVLELRHPVQPAEPRDAVEDPGEPRVRAHGRLQEQHVPPRVDAAGQQRRGHLPGLARQRLRLLPDGDGVQIDDAEDAVMVVLQRHPIADRAEIIAKRAECRKVECRKRCVA